MGDFILKTAILEQHSKSLFLIYMQKLLESQ